MALIRRILHLRAHTSDTSTPLYRYYPTPTTSAHVTAHALTTAFRLTAQALRSSLNIDPMELSARSTRPGGATALLCANVDTDVIRLLGRWRSDEMLRYLHVQAVPAMQNLARRMVLHGQFSFSPIMV